MRPSRAFIFIAVFFLGGFPAHANTKTLEVVYPEDMSMSCGELSEEALVMRDIIEAAQDFRDKKKMENHGVTAAGTVGSLVVGTVTGGIGLAAAGMIYNHVNDEEVQDIAALQDVAEQRRVLMMGIYNAKGCFGPVDHAMQPIAAEPVAKTAAHTEKTRKPRYNQ